MIADSSPAGGPPARSSRAPNLPDDNTIAARVQAAWQARGFPVIDYLTGREMAVVAVNTVMNAIEEAGYLAP